MTVHETENAPAEVNEPADEIGDTGAAVPAPDLGEVTLQSETEEELVGATVGLGVASHTQSQIKSYLKSSGVSVYSDTTYSRTPNTTAGSYEMMLIWHCASPLFYKIDCRVVRPKSVSNEMSSPYF